MPLSQYDYFDLMFDLEKITGKSVDMVALEKIKNKFFLSRINKEKIKLYESWLSEIFAGYNRLYNKN